MKIAVVGAGISGLSSAWLLSQKHEVHLFESEKRLGGHAHTFNVTEKNGTTVPMDTGFLVYNELTYPNLVNFFRELQVETVDSEMSLSIQVKSKKLEWSGTNLNSVFSQRRNLVNPRFYWMLSEILRFGREADENVVRSRRQGWSLGQLLAERRFARSFYTDYLLPIGAAIWSTPETDMLDFPAETFLMFFINHKLLQVNGRPIWRTVKNGSIQYVQKAAQRIAHIHTNSPVSAVERRGDAVMVTAPSETLKFDAVVMATHAPITARILKNQSIQEQRILSAIRYEANHAVLHTDHTSMPRRKNCWSSWNVMGGNDLENSNKVSLSYYLNRLQPLETTQDYFLTLNSDQAVAGQVQEFNYSHPQFDRAAIQAQQGLPSIQGLGGVYYAGAWSRYGFHEDGILSAVGVAERLGVRIPWSSN
ncbi:NAD(P)/FAD-dependent oxidoreductase [Bdellovibrio sp. HCB209]|uniref:NAD(P)/FAD-dependent oxidoreductase n=1 Tax=Bdellovibrio sp. HCB209 TaxID=3394354 RepID=UPI0039B5872E